MDLRVSASVLLLATATGCWTDACVRGRSEPGGGVCDEVLSGVFDSATGDDATLDWCNGEDHPISTCRSLGYEVECGGSWYRPYSPAALACPSGAGP